MDIYDILLNDDYDLLTTNDGDLSVGESTLQNQMLLLMCNKGELKQYPDRGVGVSNYIETENNGSLSREIHSEFVRDGMKIISIKVNLPNINVEAEYES